MKKNRDYTLLLIFVMTISFFSCQKENDYGMVIVAVKFNGKLTTNPTVYLKANTLIMPTGLVKWDKMQEGGEDGKATFENLEPGNYYFYAREYGSSSYVNGGIGIKVVSRYRLNVYEPTIDLK